MKKQKQEFAITFRTFGGDLENVVFEFNKFCSGEHPCYNGRNGTPSARMDGHNYSKDFRIRDFNTQIGNLYRPTSDIHDAEMLQFGRFLGVENRPELKDYLANLQDEDDDIVSSKGATEIYHAMTETLKKTPVMAI